MKSKLPLRELITLYYEKHYAIRYGDIEKIREIKNKCPEIFEKQQDNQIRSIIEHAKIFQTTDQYKKMKRLSLKASLKIVE